MEQFIDSFVRGFTEAWNSVSAALGVAPEEEVPRLLGGIAFWVVVAIVMVVIVRRRKRRGGRPPLK